MVDPDTLTVLDYNTSDTAVAYFRKLNEEYQKGIVDPESFTQSYDEYISKLSTGRVLGMIDQWWDFSNAMMQSNRLDWMSRAAIIFLFRLRLMAVTISGTIQAGHLMSRAVLQLQQAVKMWKEHYSL